MTPRQNGRFVVDVYENDGIWIQNELKFIHNNPNKNKQKMIQIIITYEAMMVNWHICVPLGLNVFNFQSVSVQSPNIMILRQAVTASWLMMPQLPISFDH